MTKKPASASPFRGIRASSIQLWDEELSFRRLKTFIPLSSRRRQLAKAKKRAAACYPGGKFLNEFRCCSAMLLRAREER
jgi:hypothetical protein